MQKKQLFHWTYGFAFSNAFFLWILGIHYLFFISPFSSELYLSPINKFFILALILFAYIGYFALIAFIPFFLMAPIIFLLPKRSIVFPIGIITASTLAIFIVIDSVVFALFRFHLGGVIWSMITSGAAKEIIELSWLEYILAFLIIGFILFIESFLALRIWKRVKKKNSYSPSLWWIVFFFFCLYFSYNMLLFNVGKPAFREYYLAVRFLPYFNKIPADLLMSKAPLGFDIFNYGIIQQPDQAQKKLQYPLRPLIYHQTVKPLNVVMIVIDTWRFDMLNKEVTPTIYQFAKGATQYLNHYSGGDGTQPGIFTLFYGIPPTYWSSMKNQKVDPILIDKLLQEHYQMGIFASATLEAPAFNKTVFLKIKNLPKGEGLNPAQRDIYITHEFQNFINVAVKKPQPFFSFLFYDAAHGFCAVPNDLKPFEPVKQVCDRLEISAKTDRTLYFNRYKNALFLIDQQVSQVLKTLKDKNLLANTVVLITGDHGEEFDDLHLGYWGHSSNFYHFQTETPLVIYWPSKAPKVVHHITSHYDITPTLLTNLFGLQNPIQDYSIGHLLSNPQIRPYLIVGSYIDFGIVEPKRVTMIYSDGNFEITDQKGRAIKGAQLNVPLMSSVFSDLEHFYRSPNEH